MTAQHSARPSLVACNAAISACEKCQRWRQALALLADMESRSAPLLVAGLRCQYVVLRIAACSEVCRGPRRQDVIASNQMETRVVLAAFPKNKFTRLPTAGNRPLSMGPKLYPLIILSHTRTIGFVNYVCLTLTMPNDTNK